MDAKAAGATTKPVDCARCGRCCRADVYVWMEREDLQRWRDEQRCDILHVLDHESPVWAGDRLVSRHTEQPLGTCPFLEWVGRKSSCAIHDTKPRVCREYRPGSSAICPLF